MSLPGTGPITLLVLVWCHGRMEGGQRQTLISMSLRSTPPPCTPGYEHHPVPPWPPATAERPLEGTLAGALMGKGSQYSICLFVSNDLPIHLGPVLHMLV